MPRRHRGDHFLAANISPLVLLSDVSKANFLPNSIWQIEKTLRFKSHLSSILDGKDLLNFMIEHEFLQAISVPQVFLRVACVPAFARVPLLHILGDTAPSSLFEQVQTYIWDTWHGADLYCTVTSASQAVILVKTENAWRGKVESGWTWLVHPFSFSFLSLSTFCIGREEVHGATLVPPKYISEI